MAGIFYLVPTPLGNRDDITLRALQVLKSVDFIAAEDTRHSKPLLTHYGVKAPCISLHEHNEVERAGEILSRLQQGQTGALISDAGTPVISDPGCQLVHTLSEAGMTIVPLPGPCALITALSASGVSGDKFFFAGFLPSKQQQRQALMKQWEYAEHSVICYESPHRITDTLADLALVLGTERHIVVARELTKTFESFYRGSVSTVTQIVLSDPNHQRGEFVILVKGNPVPQEIDATVIHLLNTLMSEMPTSQAVKLAAKISGVSKNLLYQWASKPAS